MKHAAWILVVTAALAGCSGGSDDASSGPKCTDSQYLDEAGACVDHVEPSIVVTGLPSSIERFRSVSFTWSLDPGTRGMDEPVHSMDSRILAFAEATEVDNTTEPPAGGTEIASEGHKNMPDNFTASFSWDEVGLVYLKGYMKLDGHVWQALGTIDVTALRATGNVTQTVTISFPPDLDNDEVGVTAGDAVQFDNDAPYDYEISFTGDGCPSGATIASEDSATFDFLQPGPCDYVLLSPLSAADPDEDPGRLTGKVTVGKPSP